MKREDATLIIIILALIGTIGSLFYNPKSGDSNNQNTSEIVYSESYTQSLREAVIKELYGSREQYASDKTGSKSNYIDKAASKNGQIVYDESRMQAVYDSKLKEFDSMVDNAKVDEIVKSRQEQLINDGAYNNAYDKNEVTSKKVMFWENGFKYFAIAVEMGMLIYIIYYKRKKQND